MDLTERHYDLRESEPFMMNKEMMISGLRKQRNMLADLASQLEGKPILDLDDCQSYDRTTREVEKNLKALRELVAGELSRISRLQ